MNLSLWGAFAATVVLLAISPGPGAAAVMSAGMGHRFAVAFRVVLGLQVALLLQLTIVAAGVGALLAASETAFSTVRWLGAAYLIWLGLRKFGESPRSLAAVSVTRQGKWFWQGVLVNLSNPKAIVFIGALVPQFLVLERPQLPQYLIIAATMCVIDTTVMSCYGLLGSRLAGLLSDPRRLRWASRLFGTAFVSLGAGLLLSGRNA